MKLRFNARWWVGVLGIGLVAQVVGSPARAAALDERASLELLVQTIQDQTDPSVRVSLLRGMVRGLEGRRDVQAPAGWSGLGPELMRHEDQNVARLAQQLGQLFGDASATVQAMATVRDQKADVEARATALQSLLVQQAKAPSAELVALLESLLDESDMRMSAIRGYGVVYIKDAPRILSQRYASFNADEQRAVIESLATRKPYAATLTVYLENGRIPKADVPAYTARSLTAMLGKEFTGVFGRVKSVSEDKAKLIAHYKDLLNGRVLNNASAAKGRAVYDRTCGACHQMYGVGGTIGPDLTGSNRADLDYILLNMIDPNDDVPDNYKMVVITTKDGRTLAGNIANEDANRVELKMVDQETIVAKSDIASRQVLPMSLMPEGQVQMLKDGEVADLVKYLRTNKQVEAPK
ncbi:MAG: c-type cytochrome [Planctomycetota bacterium]|jgi:putative heme-binding domain-containing protein